MSKFKQIAAVVLAVPLLFTGVASAAGQIEGGNIYRVRNVTKNTAFTDPTTADKCETVQFRVRIHNPGPDPINNVRVQATLPTAAATSHSSTVTVSATDANPTSVTDTAGVNLSSSQTLAYVAGSTELLDPNGAKLSGLADGITAGGVALPSAVGVSNEQQRFVQFSAKVSCPEEPPKTCEQTGTCPPKTPPTPPKQTPPAPAALPNTGAGEVAAVALVASVLGAVLYRVRLSRNLR